LHMKAYDSFKIQAMAGKSGVVKTMDGNTDKNGEQE
jgi:hypothetical protein